MKQVDEWVVSRKQRDSQSYEDKEALGSQGKPEERCYGADRPFAIPKLAGLSLSLVPNFWPGVTASGLQLQVWVLMVLTPPHPSRAPSAHQP